MLKLVNVSKYYSSHNVIALGLRKINLELHSNEFVAIVGESGSGKTTLLNVICGIDTYEEGEMYLNGEETSYFSTAELEEYRKKYVAFVFQSYNLIDAYTVLQNVEAPLVLAGYPQKEIRPRAIEIIKRVGLEKHMNHKATKLSGGQKQRVVIARALAKDCPIIAADEPTGNLDSDSAKQIMELLHEISKDKLVIVVTHDFDQVKDYASRKIRIFDGEIVEDVELVAKEKANLPSIPEDTKKMRWFDILKIGFRNLISVPKKSVMMVIIFSVFVFFVAMAYGAFNASMRDFENVGNQYFTNTSISRIVVKKTDDSILTQADLDELAGFNQVKTLIQNDYLLDNTFWLFSPTSQMDAAYLSIKPLPLSMIDSEEDLVYGRMPLTANEVVVALNSNDLATAEEYLNQLYQANEYDSVSELWREGFTIVGVVDASTIYVTTDLYGSAYFLFETATFNQLAREGYFYYTSKSILTLSYLLETDVLEGYMQGMAVSIDDTIEDDTILLPYYSYPCEHNNEGCVVTGTVYIEDYYSSRTVDNLTFGYQENTAGYYEGGLEMNQATFDRFLSPDIYQVSIFTNTDVGVDGLVTRLRAINESLGVPKYSVAYPYRAQSGDPLSALFILISIVGSVVTLLFTLLASILITYLIFKAIINTKMRDYAIFRTIGANQRTIKKIIYMENYLTAFAGFIVVATTMIILSGQATFLSDILKYYLWYSYFVLLGLALFMAFSVSSRYCRKVFKESVHKTLKTE